MAKKRYVDQVVSTADDTIEFLESSINNHQRRLLSAIEELERKIINLSKELRTTEKGLLVGPRVNLKQAQKLHKKLARLFDETYGEGVRQTIKGFDKISRRIERSFQELGISVDFTSVDDKTIKALQTSTWNTFNQFGLQAQERIVDALYSSIVGQTSYAVLVDKIRETLSGFKDKRGGSMARYAELYANDATMIFHTEVTLKKAQDAGIKRFLYYGNIMNTTRDFCRERVGKTFTIDEIKSWDSLSWQGKSGPALTNRGGYNCRHSWVPVKVSQLDPDELESKAVDATQASLKERRARKELLMKGVPYTESELRSFNIRDLKQLASGLGLNPFGLKKQTILEMVIKEQKKAKWMKRAATAVKEASKPIQPSLFTTKSSFELKKEMRDTEKRLRELTKRGAKAEGYRSWQYASRGYLFDENGKMAYALHQEAFEARIQWYRSLPNDQKIVERRKILKSMIKSSIRKYKYDEATQKKILYCLEKGTEHMSYRLLSELERSGIKVEWFPGRGRAQWDFSRSKIDLYVDVDGSDAVAHEFAHAVDSLMASGGRGLPGNAPSGFLWQDNGVYVGKKERDFLRKEFESNFSGGLGEYSNGDGFYYKGNWLNNYEGRVYEFDPFEIRSLKFSKEFDKVLSDVWHLPRIGDEFWSMNCERYATAVSNAIESYNRELNYLKKTLRDAEAELRKLSSNPKALKTEIEALKEWRNEARKSIKDLTSIGEEGYIRKHLNMSPSWSRVRRAYPRLAAFIEKFFRVMTSDDVSVLESDLAYKYVKKLLGE